MPIALRCSIFALLLVGAAPGVAQSVRIDTAAPINTVDPRTSVGAGVDRIPVDAIDHDFTKQALAPVLESGWQPVTYRQNTDLAVEAWHWNSEGTWSDTTGHQGYFTGSTTSSGFIRHSFGYALPHRGVTRNDGTGNIGFSRITDGDESTYWKSNPYLASRFTAEDDSLHPQWVILDLSRDELVDTLRISWADPYATDYVLQYWTGVDPIHFPTRGAWVTFPHGVITGARGRLATHSLSDLPIRLRYIRIWMTKSSNTCDTHGSADPRNCVGYAMKELYLGTTSKDGVFHDILRHTPDQEQTATFSSSIDPWHAADSAVNEKEAQVGFDLFFQSGVTRGLPAMMPVALLYETPDNAATEIRYLENHKYPISYIEIGEEADGQYAQPEDYGALYLQFAAALRKVDPNLKLGGPSFEGVNEDIEVWPDAEGRTSWLGRFLLYLRQHNRMPDLQFFSFEHYPYDPCRITWASLYEEPELIRHIIDVWHADGLPASIPFFITESNLSSSTSETYEDIFAGLWLADYIGSFLTDGGGGVYYFHYLPLQLEHGCNDSAGTFGMFTVHPDYSINQPLAQFFVAQLINHEWLQADGANQLFSAASDINDGVGHTLVTAYAVKRPDGQWSVMLVNRDQENSHRVLVEFTGAHARFSGTIDESTFGRAQYHWTPPQRGFNAHMPQSRDNVQELYVGGHADPDGPIAHKQIAGGDEIELPAASVVVLRGKLD
ncbi:MAG TPA: discoidin domain-containing protein [Acidobacteriaceae bacterium]